MRRTLMAIVTILVLTLVPFAGYAGDPTQAPPPPVTVIVEGDDVEVVAPAPAPEDVQPVHAVLPDDAPWWAEYSIHLLTSASALIVAVAGLGIWRHRAKAKKQDG